MKSSLLSYLALAGISLSAQAHGIWIKRDGSGPVRILVATNKEPVKRDIAGAQVLMVHHISTLTFLTE